MSTILLWNILLYWSFMYVTILSVAYSRILTILSVEYNILLWNIITILYPWEPQNFLLTTDVNWQYCLLNNLYCYEIYYNIDHSCMPQYCLLTTGRMLTIMSVEYYIAMKYFTILCIHVSHNIVCWLLMYVGNNVCWVLYCYIKYYYYIVPMRTTILSDDCWHMLTI